MRAKFTITVDVNEDGGINPFTELLRGVERGVRTLNIKSPSGKSYKIIDAHWKQERNEDDPD